MTKPVHSNLPMPFGWFAVARSEELDTAQVKPLKICGQEFVLWRGEDGVARALDAYCPHLGAHLGYGGVVVQGNLRCPFHRWEYRGDGSVANIPYTDLIPPRLAKPCKTAWPVQEDMGIIFVWWHPDKVAPLWDLTPVPEILEEGWKAVEYDEWIVPVHCQELTENGADIAHFAALHGSLSPPEPVFDISGYIRTSSVTTHMPTSKGPAAGTISMRAPGPGISFTRFHLVFVDMLLLQLQTPLEGDLTHLRHLYFIPPNLNERREETALKLVAETKRQLMEDIAIWRHKKYLPEPTLVKGDGPIIAYREFYSRYYANQSDA